MSEQNHPEAVCQRCGGPNISWHAPSDLWNAVVGGPDGILCPVCFVREAERTETGPTTWRLAPAGWIDPGVALTAMPRPVPVSRVDPATCSHAETREDENASGETYTILCKACGTVLGGGEYPQ